MRKLTGMLLVALLSMGIYSCGSNGQKAQNANNDKQCCEHKHEHGKCEGHKHDKKCGECPLNLTEEQKAKFKEIKDKQREANAPIMEELKTKHEAMRKLMEAEPVDLTAVNALIDEIYAIKANLKKAEIAGQNEFNQLLTPEQKAKLKEMPCPHKGHGHHYHGCKDGHQGCCKDKKEGCCKDKKEGCCKDKKEGCTENK